MRVISRYLLPPMLKTTQLPTRLADPISAFTSAHECHATLRWLTWLYHARKGPSASSQPGASQNCRSLAFEMIRMCSASHIDPQWHVSSQNTNKQEQSSQNANPFMRPMLILVNDTRLLFGIIHNNPGSTKCQIEPPLLMVPNLCVVS